jgi:putative nucleotidyltransferase with HDIG domain
MAPDSSANVKPVHPHPGAAFFWWLAVASAGFWALLWTLTAPQFLGGPMQSGDIAGVDIVAPAQLAIADEQATQLARDTARQQVLQVFKRDASIDPLIRQKLLKQLSAVTALQSGASLPFAERLNLTADEKVYLIASSDSIWERIECVVNQKTGEQSQTAAPPSMLVAEQQQIRPALEASIVAKLKSSETSHNHKVAGNDSKTTISDSLGLVRSARAFYQNLEAAGKHDLLYLAVTVSPRDWAARGSTIEQATMRLLKLGPLFPDTPRSDWERTVLEFLPDSWSDKIRWTCAKVVASTLEPNVIVDAAATKRKADAAAAAVQPVSRAIKQGQVLVAKGTIISPQAANLINVLGIHRATNWSLILSLTFSLIAACTCFALFLNIYSPKHLYSPSACGLMFTVSVVTCGVAAFAGQIFPQFVPVPAAALICTIFFGPRVATGIVILLLVFLRVDNLIDNNQLIALATASCMGLGANIKRRHDLMFRGILIGVMQAGGFLCASLLSHSISSATALGQQVLLQVLGGLSSCIVAIGSLPFLEDIFGMVTPFRVTELTASDQPLLRRLEENAPGTYQHSLAVANLAEAGARAVGADVNLVRAGSLYHDIGKMVRPRYFIENQLGDTNPHDAIPPEESRDRVLAHVTDGLALAQKFGLPRAVQDFIPQHQGTTLMAYFYHKACLRDGAENVDASFYRYPGPKPQSREAAIVMLADVSEAVTHSMNDPTQDEVEATMSNVFKARHDDGQFSESGLSKDELERVKKAFARVWRTLHHERLKYPSTTTGRMPVPPEQPPKAPASSQPIQKVQE